MRLPLLVCIHLSKQLEGSNMKVGLLPLVFSLLLIGACSDGSDSSSNDPLPVYDFSKVDALLQTFLDESKGLEGLSVALVDRVQGTIHEASFGDYSSDTIVQLASVSKFTSATLLMAIHEDDTVVFDVDAPIANYLPWSGVYGASTTTQLLSNTSGIPGLGGDIEPHECQYDPDDTLEDCARLIYATELLGTTPSGTAFYYGGSQWHLAGAVAAQVTNSEWNQAFDRYIAQPCDLEVYETGNTAQNPLAFNGNSDSLLGRSNPHAGGGAIANIRDMAKLLLLHIREGMCGDNRILSPEAVSFMQVNRKAGLPATPSFAESRSYGMGWWGRDELPGVFYDSGAYGSVVWIDTKRMIGGFVAVEDLPLTGDFAKSWDLVLNEIIPLVGELVDEARNGSVE
jgi:CubicO group peptidase (beta-lactamase class C family)